MSRFDDLSAAMAKLAEKTNHACLDAASFIARVEQLDTLENYVFELEGSHPDPSQDQQRHTLLQRVIALHDELQGVNEQMFRRYRANIVAGNIDRAALSQEFHAYATRDLQSSNDNLLYDTLDVLLAGILHASDLVVDQEQDMDAEMVRYQPTPARAILEVIRQADIDSSDTFYDIGSGLGHVPILVSLLTDARAVGIELQPCHCSHAQRSAAELGLERVRFICQDARDMDFSSGTVFYFYTPFKGAMLQNVLTKLHAQAQSREIRVCTYGPYLSQAMTQPHFCAFERIDANSPVTLFKSKN